ncbi:NAD(P)-dependent oxidoreductase [Porticoccaceae bacterium]|nr:NAD(P)-dependent oxidoreductase [Porticoccaceae bacterium]
MINNLSSKKILIIGASGQVGIELLNQLNNFDCQITAVRNSKWRNINDSNITYVNFDLCSISNDKLKNIILNHDYIFHLAGNTSVTCKKEEEFDYHLSWIEPLQKILEFLVDTDKVLVFASSATVYGSNPELPVTDRTCESPETSYDLAKVSCDNLIRYYNGAYGVNCVSLRFSNIYGPKTSDGNESRRAINKILDIIHATKEIAIVGDGRFLRNYIHVYDAAAMLIHAGINILHISPILLACSEENLTFRAVIGQLIEIYEKECDAKVEMKFDLPEKFITDKRSFSAKPSDACFRNFEYKYNVRRGFDEIVKSL